MGPGVRGLRAGPVFQGAAGASGGGEADGGDDRLRYRGWSRSLATFRATTKERPTMKRVPSLCDRCRAPLLEPGSVLRVLLGELHVKLPDELDICKECGDSFIGWLYGGKANARPRRMSDMLDY